MTTSWLIAAIAIAFATSWAGVEIFRRWSLRRNLLDQPNERSSHTVPTPRGGGLVIVVVALVGYVAGSLSLGSPLSAGYIIGAILVAGISWLDDLYSLPFWVRLITHIAAAIAVVLDLGPWEAIYVPVFSGDINFGSFLIRSAVTVGWIVWLINAYNFMDGIDGIAGLQAVVASAAWLALGITSGVTGTSLFAGILMAASLGFLLHNWQPAKIFMGDVGSAFLGFTLGSFPLLPQMDFPSGFYPLIAILAVWFFVFDTVSTMVKRVLRGERFWEAHRQHLYQQMVIRGMSHAAVTTLYGTSAAIVAAFAVLAAKFRGIYEGLLVSFVVVLTGSIVFSALWKKR